MKFFTRGGTKGITFGFQNDEDELLKPSPDADQNAPRRFYVYGHFSSDGVPFYIGKGTRRRAWETDRHPLWHRYVEKHLHGIYSVIILQDDLASEEAEEIEDQWAGQEASNLVNWVNSGRETDFELLRLFHHLRDENRDRFEIAKGLEKERIEEAISHYKEALSMIRAYAEIQANKGLVGQLIDEERAEHGIRGDIQILDRLCICLKKANRIDEAYNIAQDYFMKYRRDLTTKAALKILKRVGLQEPSTLVRADPG